MDSISLEHGAGGKLSHDLFTQVFASKYGNRHLKKAADKAVVRIGNRRIAFTTDAFIMSPRKVPGCSLGALSIHGTVNDLLTCGAKPMYVSASFVVEEGFALEELGGIAADMASAAKKCGVEIVTGDTKVVERGKADGAFVVTSGIGEVLSRVNVSGGNARPGDSVIITGSVGRHGVAVLIARGEFGLATEIKSDCRSLTGLILPLLKKHGSMIHSLRDPTRGGIGTTLNEIALESKTCVHVREADIPVDSSVKAACDLLGMDPLYMACEGVMAIVVDPRVESPVLRALRKRGAKEAASIGRVVSAPKGRVLMTTSVGGTRNVGMLRGISLPRIC